MTASQTEPRRREIALDPPAKASAGVLRFYAATLFMSALLLFSVQPMVARMALPLMGGSSAVWTTAMLFFQGTLLAGYACAHASIRVFGVRVQALGQLVILVSALLTLPLGLSAADAPPANAPPVLWMLFLLTLTVGLPFFALSATAPALQYWFAGCGHPAGRDPYFLYGASNLGSLLALIGYPLVLEPYLTVKDQSFLWASLYSVLVIMIGLCALVLISRTTLGHKVAVGSETAGVSASTPWRRRLQWMVLAFVPSSLLLGVTAHMTADVAAVPMLWVVPLAIYLLTFVLIFSRRPILRHEWMLWLQPFALVPLVAIFWLSTPATIVLPMLLVAFFILTMVCHGELAARRPPAERLTEFYLWMSIGGALGGVFNALLAPVLFDAVYEFPLALAATCLFRPWRWSAESFLAHLKATVPLAVIFAIVFARGLGHFQPTGIIRIDEFAAVLTVALVLFGLRHRPPAFALALAVTLVVPMVVKGGRDVLERERSFYGTYRVDLDPTGALHLLVHGTTLHGAQYRDPARRHEPITYYFPGSPIAQVLTRLASEGRSGRVGVVGLGAGALACYRRPGQTWTFYEIDPLIVDMVKEGRYFTYLNDCAPEARILLGDARLSLRQTPPGSFDILVLDAFSSDAIPVHLMTREALALYLSRLASGGVLAFHVSNRTLDLAPILARVAADIGLAAWYQYKLPDPSQFKVHKATEWVVMARDPADLEFVDDDSAWRRLSAKPGARPWTDEFSNLIEAVRW